MSMTKIGVTEQDISAMLTGKQAIKQSNTLPQETSPLGPIGEDFMSKLASKAKSEITLKTGRSLGKTATGSIVK
jgi:hypothetical protein